MLPLSSKLWPTVANSRSPLCGVRGGTRNRMQ
jgi:hypothetical protein